MAQRLTAPHYYGALCLLVDEAGFLVESKTAALIAELPANEAKLVAADSIVRALGVTDGPGFDTLMEALTADGSGSLSNAGGGCIRIYVSCVKCVCQCLVSVLGVDALKAPDSDVLKQQRAVARLAATVPCQRPICCCELPLTVRMY